MHSFWEGFYKKAGADPLEQWEADSKQPTKKSKEDIRQKSTDAQTLSAGYTPDTYWRSWP